jgi:fructokinase
VAPIDVVSTVGAGDNFNAGIIYSLLKQDIQLDDLATLSEQAWDSMVSTGMRFSAEVCKSFDNSVPKGFTI